MEDITALLPYLGWQAGALTVQGVSFDQLWNSEAPWLLYLPHRACANARTLRTAFARHFEVSLHFPLKSCYLPAIGTALRAEGHGVEIMSDLEWRLARQFGFRPKDVVANSPARSTQHRRELVAAGTGLIGVDSVEELEQIEYEARAQGVRAQIAVRINPLDEPGAFFSAGSKLGADLNSAADLIDRALASPSCRVAALHAHQLRHCTDPSIFHRMVRGLADVAQATAPAGNPFRLLNLGGGLESRFLLERVGSSAGQFAEAARDALDILPVVPSIILEPGRYVVGDSAIGFSSVVGRKSNSSENWLISEMSSNILIPLPDLAYHPVPVRVNPEEPWENVHVGDATCAPSHLCREATLPMSAVQDGIGILNCGAYTSVYAELWAFPLPRIGVLDAHGELCELFGPAQEADMFRSLYGVEDSGTTTSVIPNETTA
ncbi:diaminopimelate decarboxylase family protein [Streptomyces sasae]|uniref:diaminopimelate decarboxylase family protein n=1 Tax=Streptomyces sasae TaxID=1266772 RepID=UPI002931B980|nr:hypothetical protein [Streptomyces sasae]